MNSRPTVADQMRTAAIRRSPAAMLLLAAAMLGCGPSSDFEVAPAKGTVTLNGAPLTSGKVMFAPVAKGGSTKAGKPGFAVIGPDGSFELSTYGAQDGAVVAEHAVTIINSEPDSPSGKRLKASRVTLPDRQTVAADKTNEFKLELTSEIIARYGMRF